MLLDTQLSSHWSTINCADGDDDDDDDDEVECSKMLHQPMSPVEMLKLYVELFIPYIFQ